MTKGIFTALLFLVLSGQIYSQAKEDWMNLYTTKGQLSMDKAMLIGTDANGNTYVTGTSMTDMAPNEDILTVKLDKDGKFVWAAVYNGDGNYNDEPLDMFVDPQGNVYITGGSTGANNTATDMITIKYNSAGQEQWVARYNGTAEGHREEGRSIAVDANGDVYVFGVAPHIATDNSGDDFVLVKYNSLGQQQWVKAYDEGISSGEGIDMVIDGSAIYVTGANGGPSFDIKTIKYDKDGNMLWEAGYDGGGNDIPVAIAVDGTGNVIVTGATQPASGNFDIVTIKYSSSGQELWKHIYAGTANKPDEPVALLTDASGNVYMAGVAVTNNKKDYLLIKFAPDGTVVWSSLFDGGSNGEDVVSGMVMDSNGDVFLVGTAFKFEVNPLPTMTTVKYDNNGSLLWTAFASSLPDQPSHIDAVGIALTNDGVVVTGTTMTNPSAIDYCTLKYPK